MNGKTETSEAGTSRAGDRLVRIRVWFGPHLVRELAAAPGDAAACAEEMPYRFHGLRITIGNLDPAEQLDPLPTEPWLWPLTVR